MAFLDDVNRYAVSPVTTATAYATADAFGAVLPAKKFSPNGRTGAYLKHHDSVLKGTVAVPVDVLIFTGTLTTPAADNAVFAVQTADLSKLVGRFQIAAADWVAIPGAVGGAFSCHKDIDTIFIAGAGEYTVAFLVGTGGPFTPSVANALTVTLIADQVEDAA